MAMLDSDVPATMLLPSDKIVAVITYTASLSSDSTAVDPLLDDLRAITSSGTPVESRDIEVLHDLQRKLEDFLVHREKLRSFTYDSLHFHIKERFTGNSRLKRLNWTTAGIISLGIVMGAVTVYANAEASPDRSLFMGLSVLYAVLYLGMAGLFAEAIKELTLEARQAYTYIFVGMGITGVVMLVQPLVALTPLQFHPISPTIINIPQIITLAIIYTGIRKVALLAGVPERTLSYKSLLVGVGIVSAIALVVPSAMQFFAATLPFPYFYFIVTMFFQGLHVLLMIVAAFVLWRTHKKFNQLYARGVKALMFAVIVHSVVSTYFFLIYWPIVGKLYPNIWLALGMSGILIVSILYLRASYIFNKVHHY